MTSSSDLATMLDLLKTWLPAALIERLNREVGFVQRDRKIDPVFLVWTPVLGWTAGATHSLDLEQLAALKATQGFPITDHAWAQLSPTYSVVTGRFFSRAHPSHSS